MAKNIRKHLTFAYISCCLLLFFLIVFFSLTGPSSLILLFGKKFSLSFFISFAALPIFYLGYFFLIKNHNLNKLIILLAAFGIILLLNSLGMSLILYNQFSGLFSTNPVKVGIEELIKYAYDFSVIPYFVFCLSYLNKGLIKKIVYTFLVLWILFGIFQAFCFYLNKASLWNIYDSLNFLGVFGGTSEVFERIRKNYGYFRFYGIASEPSSNASLICAFLIPFLFYQIVAFKRNKRFLITNGTLLLIVLIFSVLTMSASVFTGLAIDAAALVAFLFKSKVLSKRFKLSIGYAAISICAVLMIIPSTRDIIVNRLFLKLFDTNNYSTQYRYSTIWNDILCFIKSPIFGVGDGNQGYFYASHVSGTWMANSPETQAAIRGEYGLLNGGAGLPSFISGFGIFGLVVAFVFARKIFLDTKKCSQFYERIRTYFYLGLAIQLVFFAASSGLHRNYLLLISLTMQSACRYNCLNIREMVAHSLTKNIYRRSRAVSI